MKVVSSDNSELMNIKTVAMEGDALLVGGEILGAMPMKAVIQLSEVRRFAWKLGPMFLFRVALRMLLRIG